MDIRLVTDEREWDRMVRGQPHTQFLQSWQWGEFQASLGRPVTRYGGYADNQLQIVAQVIDHTIRGRWHYWYIPRGPEYDHALTDDAVVRASQELLARIVTDAHTAGALFVTVELPLLQSREKLVRRMLTDFQVQSVRFIQPRDTLLLDLRQSKATLLDGMHHKTRYNIRLAERKGVTVRQSQTDADIAAFVELTAATAQRDAITVHADSYYRDMIDRLGNPGPLTLYVAEYLGRVIAANIVMHVGDTVTYVHGASANEHRNVMAPHLLQWRQIQDAQTRGARWYDFWGVGSATTGTERRWAGITRFKQGFGGAPVNYVSARNLILRPGWYTLYKFARRMKR